MGYGFEVKCTKCKFKQMYLLGVGMMFSEVYRRIVESVRVGAQLDFDVPMVSYTVAEYTLSYDANGGTGNVNPTAGVAGTAVVIEQNGFERSGYTFTGWNTAADGSGTSYNVGDSFTMPADNTVLYAQWSKNAPVQVKLSYDANGGTGTMTPSTADAGSTFTIAQNSFTRSGFTFTGWNTAADGKGTAYKAGEQHHYDRQRYSSLCSVE